MKKTIILGAGISGLTAAFHLKKNNYEFEILDNRAEAGGVMESFSNNGYLFDRGPNSGLETSPTIKEIVDEVGLADDFVYANQEGNKRYIIRNNKLMAIPVKPGEFIKSELFSGAAKLRLFAEPFIGRSEDGYYQSIADFVKRRLGREFLDYAINPFVAGVYAGSPEELSVKSAFPKLYALEEKYGGIFVGAIKSSRERKKRAEQSKHAAKMFSFRNGMQSFPKAIAAYIGDKIRFNCEVTKVLKNGEKYLIEYVSANETFTTECDSIISTVPAYKAGEIFKHLDSEGNEHFSSVYYPPVAVMYLGYNKTDIKRPLDGFGFLIPAKEKKTFLGAIFSSVLFPSRSPEEKASFTLFIGGSRSPELFSLDKEILIKKVIEEFQELMQIEAKPVYNSMKMWEKAIPQYNIGYIEHENYFNEFEKKHKGIILGGNYRGGISVGDCVKNSVEVFKKLKELD